MFDAEAVVLRRCLGDNAMAIHHIGSTAVPGLCAKPIIDLLVEVASLDDVDVRNAEMARAGYEAMGEFGIAGRRYFRKRDRAGVRSHHVHAFACGSSDVTRHLAFRDYLKAHPADARRYGDLKRALASVHHDDIDAYMDGKDALVKALERAALAWEGAAII